MLSDLHESVCLEQHADAVLVLCWPDPCASDPLELNIAGIISAGHSYGSARPSFEPVIRKEPSKFENVETRRTPQPQGAQAESAALNLALPGSPKADDHQLSDGWWAGLETGDPETRRHEA